MHLTPSPTPPPPPPPPPCSIPGRSPQIESRDGQLYINGLPIDEYPSIATEVVPAIQATAATYQAQVQGHAAAACEGNVEGAAFFVIGAAAIGGIILGLSAMRRQHRW